MKREFLFVIFRHIFGEHHEKENPKFEKSQATKINMIYTEVPHFLEASLNISSRRVKWIFLVSVNENEATALTHFEIGASLIGQGDLLYLTHLDAWRQIWATGRVQAGSGENFEYDHCFLRGNEHFCNVRVIFFFSQLIPKYRCRTNSFLLNITS